MATVSENIRNRKKWADLSTTEQRAAENDGWTENTWDAQYRTSQTYQAENQFFKTLEKFNRSRTPVTESMGAGEIEALSKTIKDIRTGVIDVSKLSDDVLNLLAKEDSLRLEISQTLGASNEVLFDMIGNINQSGKDLSKFNLTAVQVMETLSKMTVEIGRNIQIPKEALNRATLLTKTLKGFDAGKFASAFDTIGYSLGEAFGAVDDMESPLAEIYTTAGDLGVVSEQFLGSVVDNLNKANTFGFDKGVRGLSEMVARGQKLGLEMDKVTGLAEKFFDPESAIEFAANMQMIGGSVGSLTDPFKLMYQATNDMEGLQKSIIDTAAAAATFDKEKGKFVISPDSRRQLKAMAGEMGMSYQELADMAVQSARRAEVFEELEFTGMKETDKELISSMAKISESGKVEIKVPGMDQMMDVSDLTEKELQLLRKEGRTDSDLYAQQLTAQEKSGQSLAAMEAMMRIQLQEEGIGSQQIQSMGLSQRLSNEIPTLSDEDLQNIMNENYAALPTDVISSLEDMVGGGGTGSLVDRLNNLFNINDAIIKGDKVYVPSPDDNIIATKSDVDIVPASMDNVSETNISSLETIITKVTESPNMRGGTATINGRIELISPDGSMSNVNIKRFIELMTAGDAQQFMNKLSLTSNPGGIA